MPFLGTFEQGHVTPSCQLCCMACTLRPACFALLTITTACVSFPTGTPDPPLAKCADWVATTDPAGRPAKRETSTMPQWAGSCWYYLRYIDPLNSER